MSNQNGQQEIRNQLNNIKSTLTQGNVIGSVAVGKVKEIIETIQKRANETCELTQQRSIENRKEMLQQQDSLQKETNAKQAELAAAKQELQTSQAKLEEEAKKAIAAVNSQLEDREKVKLLEQSVNTLTEQINVLNKEIQGRTKAIKDLQAAHDQERIQMGESARELLTENAEIHEMYKQLFSKSLGEIQQQLESMTFEKSGLTNAMSGGFQSSSSGVTDFKKYRSSSRSYSSRIKDLRKKRKESKKNRKKRKDKKKSETKKIYIEDKRRR